MIMISLVGEQPIPNLLPLLHEKPAIAALVHSSLTKPAATRLQKLAPVDCNAVPCPVEDAYDIDGIRHRLLEEVTRAGWQTDDLLFNLTGGTKSMALAAFLAAAELRTPFIYLQTEGKQSRLYRYHFDAAGAACLTQSEILPDLLTLDLYLRAYVGDYTIKGPANDQQGGRFEKAIQAALVDFVDEIVVGVELLGALDVDLVLRCGNQFGVMEAKTGSGLKRGIDQLNTAAGQRYLGSYVGKLLVKDTVWNATQSNLRELAKARNITVVELPSYATSGSLSAEDILTLRQSVAMCLGQPSRAAAETTPSTPTATITT